MTALLLIGAPLVSGFASMSSTCGDKENWLQTVVGTAPADEFGGVDPSLLTCPVMTASCGAPSIKLICAGTCQYHGACTGDAAVALLFAPPPDDEGEEEEEGESDDSNNDDNNDNDENQSPMTCAMLALTQALMGLGNSTGNEADAAAMSALFSIANEICGTSRRARKLTDAPRMDAPKAHKLAAAMLRSIKTTVHRLAQVRGLGQ
jgi:hypothetical protein